MAVKEGLRVRMVDSQRQSEPRRDFLPASLALAPCDAAAAARTPSEEWLALRRPHSAHHGRLTDAPRIVVACACVCAEGSGTITAVGEDAEEVVVRFRICPSSHLGTRSPRTQRAVCPLPWRPQGRSPPCCDSCVSEARSGS